MRGRLGFFAGTLLVASSAAMAWPPVLSCAAQSGSRAPEDGDPWTQDLQVGDPGARNS